MTLHRFASVNRAKTTATGSLTYTPKCGPRFRFHHESPPVVTKSWCVVRYSCLVVACEADTTHTVTVSTAPLSLLVTVMMVVSVAVQCLEEWLDASLRAVQSHDAMPPFDGVVVGEQEVLFVCLHELGRQVYVHCEERGRLLMRVQQYVPGAAS